MSLEFRNVEIRVRGKIRTITLKNINFRVDPKQRVAVLCAEAAAMPGLVNTICGVVPPRAGSVKRNSHISWPIPDGSFCHKHLSFIANARFVATLYEVEHSSFISQVLETAAVGESAGKPLYACPKPLVTRFLFALGACLPFDTYLFTNTSIGEKADWPKYGQMIADLGRDRGLIVATAKPKIAEAYCDRAFVIDGKTTHFYDDIEAASEHMARLAKRSRSEEGEEEAEAEEEQAFDDF